VLHGEPHPSSINGKERREGHQTTPSYWCLQNDPRSITFPTSNLPLSRFHRHSIRFQRPHKRPRRVPSAFHRSQLNGRPNLPRGVRATVQLQQVSPQICMGRQRRGQDTHQFSNSIVKDGISGTEVRQEFVCRDDENGQRTGFAFGAQVLSWSGSARGTY